MTTYSRRQGDKNLFYQVNRGRQMKNMTQDYNVPQRFSEPSPYNSYAVPIHPLPKERGGDASAHYRMLRKGLLPEEPTHRRRIYIDLDPETRIEETLPTTREERQQDKIVSGIAKLSASLNEFLGKSNVPYRQKVQASQTALRAMLENYNVPMGDEINKLINQMTPAHVKDIFGNLEGKLDRQDINTSEAERLIRDTITKEAKHVHKEERGDDEGKHLDPFDEGDRKDIILLASARIPPLELDFTTDDDRDIFIGSRGGRFLYRNGRFVRTSIKPRDLPHVPERSEEESRREREASVERARAVMGIR